MMQTLIVVLHDWQAFLAPRNVVGGGIDNVAGKEILPEGETPGRTYDVRVFVSWSS